jgi:hypothetical protein
MIPNAIRMIVSYIVPQKAVPKFTPFAEQGR